MLVARGKILTIHPLGGAHSKPFLPRTAIRNTVDATRHGVCGDARRRSLPTVRQPVPAPLPCLAMRTKTLCGVDQARPRARRTALRCAAHDIPGARRCRVPAALPGLAMRTTTLCGVDKAIVHAALPAHPPRHSHVFGHSCRRTLSLPTTLLTHGCTCTCRDRRSDQLQPQSPARSQPAVQSARFVALSTVAQGLADLTAQFKLLLEAELQCTLCPTADNTDKAAGSSTHAHLLQCPSCRAIFQAVVVGTAQTPPEREPGQRQARPHGPE